MATQLQIRRGTTAQMNAFTGAEGELAVNTTTDTLHVHDGATAGGKPLARADGSNIATYAGSFTTLAASSTATLNTLVSSGATLTGGTINGVTVGASTPSTGAFTTLAASGAITGNVTGNLTGSVLTAAQTNITSVGTLSSLAVTGALTGTSATFNGTVTASPSGGVATLGTSGHITSKQSLDVATAGGRFIGSSNRGMLGQIRIEQTANSTDGGYIAFDTSPSGSTSPQERMRIDGATGSVGIGKTPLGNNLSPALEMNSGGTMFGYGDAMYLTGNLYYNGGWKAVATGAGASIILDATGPKFYTNASASAGATVTPVERMRIDSTGSIISSMAGGVFLKNSSGGTSGTQILVSNTGGSMRAGVESSGGNTIQTGTSAYAAVFGNQGNYATEFTTNGAVRLSINNTGAIFATGVRSSSSANNDLRYNTSNGEIYYQTSSKRYKSNIADLEFDTSNLYNLRPVSFDDNETGERCFGLIAEDTFEQIPEAVVTRDIDGETVPDSIPYSMLSVLIINEMKNLKAENDSLRSRIEALENN